MELNTRQDFADYCLRQLGGGVVNIELSDEQIEDGITDAIQYYNEYHFDGIERDYVKFQVVGTKITVASTTGFAVGDIITTTQGASCEIIDITNNVITTEPSTTVVKLGTGHTITNGTATTTVSACRLGTVDLGYIELPENIFSVTKVINTAAILQHSDILFNIQYQIMSNEVRNITSGQANYLYSTMNYLSHLDFILRKEKSYRFNRRMNRLHYDVSWNIKTGDWFVFECYFTLDPEVFSEVYNDIWLKKYATAKLKKLWGTNLSKYSGVTLPGGITYNGREVLQDAMIEIEKLEAEAQSAGAPLGFMVG